MRYLLSVAAFLAFSFSAHASLQTDLDQAMANYNIRISVAYNEYNEAAAGIEDCLLKRMAEIDQEKFEKDASYGNEEYNKALVKRDAELAQAKADYDAKVAAAAGLYKSEADAACRSHTGRNCRW